MKLSVCSFLNRHLKSRRLNFLNNAGLENEDSYFMVLGGFPLTDITSDDSGASRTVAKRGYMPTEGLFSFEANRKDFGLIRLEKQIIALTVAGYSSEETAKRIGISEPALGLHLTSIYDKLRVSNQFELILFALYHQLINSYDSSPPCD